MRRLATILIMMLSVLATASVAQRTALYRRLNDLDRK